jgi:plasmid rolling circle replication initiator protein Rep
LKGLDKLKTPSLLLGSPQTTNLARGITLLQATDPIYLSTLSPKDSRWDDKRSQADRFKALYQGTEYNCYAVRIADCSCHLLFAFQVDDTGLCKLKLQAAKFCRVRLCPVCQDRRSIMWRGKAFKILPKVLEDYPKARFIFLTLTVRNCPLDELRSKLNWMHKSWRRLIERKEFAAVDGWIRSVEVTRGADDTAHPHYHCLLMVKPGYFGKNYVTQEQWSILWQECLGVEYNPIVDVRAVKPKKGTPEEEQQFAVMAAIVETIKYSCKPSDSLRSDGLTAIATVMSNQQWLVELTKQLHKTRAIATGGVLKAYLKLLEDDPEDLIHVDENGLSETDSESPRVIFGWREKAKRYRLED